MHDLVEKAWYALDGPNAEVRRGGHESQVVSIAWGTEVMRSINVAWAYGFLVEVNIWMDTKEDGKSVRLYKGREVFRDSKTPSLDDLEATLKIALETAIELDLTNAKKVELKR